MFHGSLVALVTPMANDGSVDEKSLWELIEMHIDAGTDGIVVVGTTGESATLSESEQQKIIKTVVKQVRGRLPIIAGTGVNSTAKTITLTRSAMELGIDACLIVTPYYNKPTQEGLYQHYKVIAHEVAIPIILYNVPGRTGVDMLAETVARLANIPNIIGIKEATGKIERGKQILELSDNNMDLYSGDDATALELMLAGAKGVISVTANIAPQLMHEMCQAALAGDQDRAMMLNEKLQGLHTGLFVESNPIPTKWLLHRMGLIPSGIRLPLTPLASQYHTVLENALRQANITLQ